VQPTSAQLDQKYIWHPFTQMRDWLRGRPIVIVEGTGAMLRDTEGNEYLDANSSIWTTLHGHAHPEINAAIESQLKKIAHSSALGLANVPAAYLAQKLVQGANHVSASESSDGGAGVAGVSPREANSGGAAAPPGRSAAGPALERVFFSDDGSTAMEVALKLAYQYARRAGRSRNPKFLSLDAAYHGDTIGAVSVGHIDLFHKSYAGLLFKSDRVMSPYCYRCPFNRAKPERSDAREYRKCNWECVGKIEQKFLAQKKKGNPYAAFVFEPLIQGAAGMIAQPAGWLARASQIARSHGAQLIADEVMTAFGRTGAGNASVGPAAPGASRTAVPDRDSSSWFACHRENVQPDYLALAKGLTGGYLPMAATLTTGEVFDAFLGEYEDFKTFFHGHSFTANQLGAASALASLEILDSESCRTARRSIEATLRRELKSLWAAAGVGDIRQVGLIAGVELVRDWKTRQPFELRERAGIRVCEGMARRGVLTRAIGNVVVLMPPYCTTPSQLRKMVAALRESVFELGGGNI
jgi:adenosylmethionine---8-amino-7-oxononanoate aminotransferase